MAEPKAKGKSTNKAETGAGGELHRYRSHTCGALRSSDIGNNVRLSG
jgi:aspartyl-tRNA synthetase